MCPQKGKLRNQTDSFLLRSSEFGGTGTKKSRGQHRVENRVIR
jgi:hypothetical protein